MAFGHIPGAPAGGMQLGSGSALGTGSGSTLGINNFAEVDDVNPMENMTNMVDVMLVLAVGLMMSLVVAMNVNLLDIKELMDEDLTEVEKPEEIIDDVHSTKNPYQEMGKVYLDPKTGKTYIIKENGELENVEANPNGEAGSQGQQSEGQ